MARKRVRSGAPVVNNGLYRDLHRRVNRTGRQMRTVREEGYGGLDSAIKKIYKSVRTTQNGVKRDLDKYNTRTIEKILQHTANSRAANRRLTNATEKRLDAFGGGGFLTQRNAQEMSQLNRTRRSDSRVAEVGARGVGVVADTAQTQMNVMQQGTQEAQANANALAAESFSQRTNEDLALISQQHHDITMSKIQAQQRMAELEKQHEYAMKQLRFQERNAEDAMQAAGGVGLVKQQVTTATSIAQELYSRVANGESANTVLQEMVERGVIDAEDINSGTVKYLARAAQMDQGKGYDVDHMTRELMYALEQMPAFAMMKPKQKEKLRDYVRAQALTITLEQQKKGGLMGFVTEGTEGGMDLGSLIKNIQEGSLTDEKGISSLW